MSRGIRTPHFLLLLLISQKIFSPLDFTINKKTFYRGMSFLIYRDLHQVLQLYKTSMLYGVASLRFLIQLTPLHHILQTKVRSNLSLILQCPRLQIRITSIPRPPTPPWASLFSKYYFNIIKNSLLNYGLIVLIKISHMLSLYSIGGIQSFMIEHLIRTISRILI